MVSLRRDPIPTPPPQPLSLRMPFLAGDFGRCQPTGFRAEGARLRPLSGLSLSLSLSPSFSIPHSLCISFSLALSLVFSFLAPSPSFSLFFSLLLLIFLSFLRHLSFAHCLLLHIFLPCLLLLRPCLRSCIFSIPVQRSQLCLRRAN